MKKITSKLALALRNRATVQDGNTRCTGDTLYLHNNAIAYLGRGRLCISLAGWNTPTTRERVNGVLSQFNSALRLSTKRGQAYLGTAPISSALGDWHPIPDVALSGQSL